MGSYCFALFQMSELLKECRGGLDTTELYINNYMKIILS